MDGWDTQATRNTRRAAPHRKAQGITPIITTNRWEVLYSTDANMDSTEQVQEILDITMDLEPNRIPQQTHADVAGPVQDMPQEAVQTMGQVADKVCPTAPTHNPQPTGHGDNAAHPAANQSTPLTHLLQQQLATAHLPRHKDPRKVGTTSHLRPTAMGGKVKGHTKTTTQHHDATAEGTTKRTQLLQSSITTFLRRYYSAPIPTQPTRDLYHKKSFPKRHMHPTSTTHGLDTSTITHTKDSRPGGDHQDKNPLAPPHPLADTPTQPLYIPAITQPMLWDHTPTPPTSEIDWSDEEALIDQFLDSEEETMVDHTEEPENGPPTHTTTPPTPAPPTTTLPLNTLLHTERHASTYPTADMTEVQAHRAAPPQYPPSLPPPPGMTYCSQYRITRPPHKLTIPTSHPSPIWSALPKRPKPTVTPANNRHISMLS